MTISSPWSILAKWSSFVLLTVEQKVLPSRFPQHRLCSLRGNVLCPSALPSPMCPSRPSILTNSWGRTAAGRFLDLFPLTSLLPDRASRLHLQLGISLAAKRNPTWLYELKSPTEVDRWWCASYHWSDMSHHKKQHEHWSTSMWGSQPAGGQFRDMDITSSLGGIQALQCLYLGLETIQM